MKAALFLISLLLPFAAVKLAGAVRYRAEAAVRQRVIISTRDRFKTLPSGALPRLGRAHAG
jgi:hypothetical protein